MLQLLIGLRGPALLRLLPHVSSAQRCLFATKKLDWMDQAEMDASKAKMAGGNPTDIIMGQLEHELQGERVSGAMKLEDKLRSLIKKCDENKGDTKLFNAIRKRALVAREELTVQREAAGMAKDSALNAATIEATFPIPASM
jgi:hypothetical protein